MTFVRLADEEDSPDTSEIWEARGRRVARRLRSAKMALVTLSVLKSPSLRVCYGGCKTKEVIRKLCEN